MNWSLIEYTDTMKVVAIHGPFATNKEAGNYGRAMGYRNFEVLPLLPKDDPSEQVAIIYLEKPAPELAKALAVTKITNLP